MNNLPSLLQSISAYSPTGLVALIALTAIAVVGFIAAKAIDAVGGRTSKGRRG